MNTPFGDELKKGVKGLWAPLLPLRNSSTTSRVDSMYVPLHDKYEEYLGLAVLPNGVFTMVKVVSLDCLGNIIFIVLS